MGKPFHQQTQLFSLFDIFNFHQVIQPPTRCANILQWLVINNLRLVIYSDVLPPLGNLDHSPILLELNLNFCTHFLSFIKCWDYSRADFKKLNEILHIVASPTPDIALTNINDTIN